MEQYDLIIVGSGPVGLSAAIAAKRASLRYLVLERGVLCNSIFNFPVHMTFFTTADLLEIGGHPFPSTSSKPSRQMALDYYRLVVKNEELEVRTYHEVLDVSGEKGAFTVHCVVHHPSGTGGEEIQLRTKYVIIATGYFDNPRGLDVPGADLPHVALYYDEPHPYFQKNVVVVGAGNSGAEAALELYRHGAKVTLVHNHPEPRKTLKYWIAQDLKNRLARGEIRSVMPAEVVEITPRTVVVRQDDRVLKIPADHVFLLTGFTPDVTFLKKLGLSPREDLSIEVSSNFESSRRGLFLVGSVAFGRNTNSVFIENGREHAVTAVEEISNRVSSEVE